EDKHATNTTEVPKTETKAKTMTDKDKQEFVADVIKEYLHLSASSVKIKFPLVMAISNEMLIEQTKHLPFYQYHDFMVRIMEKEMKRTEEEKKKKQLEEEEKRKSADLMLQKSNSRRSLLGNFFGLFAGKEDGKEQHDPDNDEDTDDEEDEKEFQNANEVDSSHSSPVKGHVKSRSSNNILSPNLVPHAHVQNTRPNVLGKPRLEHSHTEYARQTSISLLENDKASDNYRDPIPTTPQPETIPDGPELEELSDDDMDLELDLDKILDDETLTKDIMTKNSRGKSASPVRNRSQSNERPSADTNTSKSTKATNDHTQTRRTGRTMFTRALSRNKILSKIYTFAFSNKATLLLLVFILIFLVVSCTLFVVWWRVFIFLYYWVKFVELKTYNIFILCSRKLFFCFLVQWNLLNFVTP
ncbi:hypothetical protein RFI_12595, partial [Reticulomyxa filosa]